MSIVPPETFGLNYGIELTEQEQKLLNLDDANNAVVSLIVYKQKSSEDADMKVVIKPLSLSILKIRSAYKNQWILSK